MPRFIFIFILALSYVNCAYASGDWKDFRTVVYDVSTVNSKYHYALVLNIALFDNNKKILYFRIAKVNESNKIFDICKQDKGKYFLNANGTNIALIGGCSKDGDHMSLGFITESDEGQNYIVNVLKKSKKEIKLRFSKDLIFNVSPNGFTRQWDEFGGDAI